MYQKAMQEKENIQKQVQQFLLDNGFELGSFGCKHEKGIGYYCALVRPIFSPKHGAYAIAVTPDKIVGYTCQQPYDFNQWEILWAKPYQTKEQLIKLLKKEIAPPKGIWCS